MFFSLVSGPQQLEEAALLALLTATVLFVLDRLTGSSFKALELSDVVYFSGLAVVVGLAGDGTHEPAREPGDRRAAPMSPSPSSPVGLRCC